MPTVSNHYKIVYKVLTEYQVSAAQSEILAHAASVYSDHPEWYFLMLNNAVSTTLNDSSINQLRDTLNFQKGNTWNNGIFEGVKKTYKNYEETSSANSKSQILGYDCRNPFSPNSGKWNKCETDYSKTTNSQETNFVMPFCDTKGYYSRFSKEFSREDLEKISKVNYNIWHSMRSPQEKEAFDKGNPIFGVSPEKAKERGMKFGWDNIFSIAEIKENDLENIRKNTEAYQKFGQGIHAIQDGLIHKGCSIDEHSVLHDITGVEVEVINATRGVVVSYFLLNGRYDKITDLNDLNYINHLGMSVEQINKIKFLTNKIRNSKTGGGGGW